MNANGKKDVLTDPLMEEDNNKNGSGKKKEIPDRKCIRCSDPLPEKWSHAMCADCMEESYE